MTKDERLNTQREVDYLVGWLSGCCDDLAEMLKALEHGDLAREVGYVQDKLEEVHSRYMSRVALLQRQTAKGGYDESND